LSEQDFGDLELILGREGGSRAVGCGLNGMSGEFSVPDDGSHVTGFRETVWSVEGGVLETSVGTGGDLGSF